MILDLKQHLPTISGLGAVILWSLLPVLSIYTNAAPSFLKLGLALLFSSIGFLIYWSVKYRGNLISKFSLPKKYIIFCVLGIFGNNLTFLEAMKGSGKVAAYVTMNAWPISTLLFSAFIWKDRLRRIDYIGSALGICGVLLIASRNTEIITADPDNRSILMAILNCLIWSLFSSFNKKFDNTNPDSIGVPLFIISLLSLACHFLFEAPISLSLKELLIIALLGLGPWGASYALWGFALHNTTNPKALLNYGFLAPVLGLTWMVLMGNVVFSMKLIIAFLCIITGTLLSSSNKA